MGRALQPPGHPITLRTEELERSVAGTGDLQRAGALLLDCEGDLDLLPGGQQIAFDRFLRRLQGKSPAAPEASP